MSYQHNATRHEVLHALMAATYAYAKGINPERIEFAIHCDDESAEINFKADSTELTREITRACSAGPVAGMQHDLFQDVVRTLDFRRAGSELSDSDITRASAYTPDLMSADEHMTLLLATRHVWKSLSSKQRADLSVKLRQLNDFIELSAVTDGSAIEAGIEYAQANLQDLQLGQLKSFKGNH